ncbi:MAG: geranylgeranyl reductase family protein [Candidatus Polarisedimenticolia bacterium]
MIIGGRVAGNTTAYYAARAGLRVLVLDNATVIGRRVQCGEFVPDADENFPAYRKRYDEVPIPKEMSHQRTEWIRIWSPAGRSFTFPFGGYTIDRDAFDQHLACLARAHGATYQLATTVHAFSGNEVITLRQRFVARVIVVASGPTSRVPRMAGFVPPTKLNQAVFCVARGSFYGDVIDVYFGDCAPGGYAWVIPKNGDANIGLGLPHFYTGNDIRGLLNRFLARFPEATPLYFSGGNIPLGGMVRPLVRGRRVAVGDAAGMVMASNGGGILPAMITGQLAGLAIADHLQHGRPLTDYERRVDEVIGTPMAIATRRKLIFDFAWRHALGRRMVFEAFFRLGGAQLIEKAIRISPLFEAKRAFLPERLTAYVNARL